MAADGTRGNKHKFKGRNGGPSRDRYWQYKRLEKSKVKALMEQHPEWSLEKATIVWQDARNGRRMRGGFVVPAMGAAVKAAGKKK